MISTYSQYEDVLNVVNKQTDTTNHLAHEIASINVTPTVQEKLLKEYYLDFDGLTKRLDAYEHQTQTDVHSLSENYDAIKNRVENLQIVVDKDTLRAIQDLVRKDTGMDLHMWVKKIQVDNIEGGFADLTNVCLSQLNSINQKLTDVITDLDKKDQKQSRLEKRTAGMAFVAVIMAFLALIIVVLGELRPLIKLLIAHPLGWALVGITGAFIAYLIYKLNHVDY